MRREFTNFFCHYLIYIYKKIKNFSLSLKYANFAPYKEGLLPQKKDYSKTFYAMKRLCLVSLTVLALCIANPMKATCSTVAATDSSALKRMAQFAGNMLTYNNNFTQEKVYLHLDNNGYIAGEKLWFKAYVFKASSLLPTDMSKVLYVDLLNPDGQLMERKTLKVDNGRTYGDFELDPVLFHPGYYELRAYTRAMLNWDEAYIYSRVLPIYGVPEDTVNFTGLTMPYHDYAKHGDDLIRSTPEPLLAPGTQKSKDLLLTFYPEGGNITSGIASRVAYKLTDKDGIPVDGKVNICSTSGNVVVESDVLHDGMGIFTLPAEWQGGYALANVDGFELARFSIPEPRQEGCDISASCNREEGLNIALRSSPGMEGRTLGLSVTCRGTLLYFNTVDIKKENSINIAYDKLRDGIAQITLFTDEGEVLSERLVWVEPHKAPARMVIRQNEEVYAPYQPVVLDISLTDSEGSPLQADFSIAVRDAATEVAPDGNGIMSDMLLASELKGYIHRPDYYFESDDAVHRQALDLLLMVQGWRRYSWKEMSGVEPFVLKQPCEEGLTLIGTLSSTHAARKNLAREGSLDVNFLMQTLEGTRMFDVPTDSTGYFAVQLPDFNGDAPSIMTVTNHKDKRIYSDFILNRNFSPAVKAYEPIRLITPEDVKEVRSQALTRKAETFEWKDTIPDYISRLVMLNEVTVTGKRERGINPGARFAWMGGEKATKGGAYRFYNLVDELDRTLDEGEAIPNVWDWLMKKDRLFHYDYDTGEMWYRGKRVLVVEDNSLDGAFWSAGSSSAAFLMNNFQSMSIVEDQSVIDQVLPEVALNNVGIQMPAVGVAIFLYSRTGLMQTIEYQRGVRWINIHGYSLCTDFYCPDYRREDVPAPTDHRRTLYWNPSLITSPEGKADVILYSGSRPDERLHINAQGIAVNGQMVEFSR